MPLGQERPYFAFKYYFKDVETKTIRNMHALSIIRKAFDYIQIIPQYITI